VRDAVVETEDPPPRLILRDAVDGSGIAVTVNGSRIAVGPLSGPPRQAAGWRRRRHGCVSSQ
jgi:hypothetical protein